MLRIFYPLKDRSQAVHFTGEKAHYLATVLRCRAGDKIVIFDGAGTSYNALIKSVARKEVVVSVDDAVSENRESPLNVILLQGLLKGEKMDMIVQKTTELGVKEIIPVITERSQFRETRRLGRWRRIAEEAARQCGRSVVPVVHEPRELRRFVEEARDGAPHKVSGIRGLIFWEDRGLSVREAGLMVSSPDHAAVDSPLYLLVGPEGGFTEEEVGMAESGGFVVTSLGTRILRTETAAITATAIVQVLLGDMG